MYLCSVLNHMGLDELHLFGIALQCGKWGRVGGVSVRDNMHFLVKKEQRNYMGENNFLITHILILTVQRICLCFSKYGMFSLSQGRPHLS